MRSKVCDDSKVLSVSTTEVDVFCVILLLFFFVDVHEVSEQLTAVAAAASSSSSIQNTKSAHLSTCCGVYITCWAVTFIKQLKPQKSLKNVRDK